MRWPSTIGRLPQEQLLNMHACISPSFLLWGLLGQQSQSDGPAQCQAKKRSKSGTNLYQEWTCCQLAQTSAASIQLPTCTCAVTTSAGTNPVPSPQRARTHCELAQMPAASTQLPTGTCSIPTGAAPSPAPNPAPNPAPSPHVRTRAYS